MTLESWATRWRIDPRAIIELRDLMLNGVPSDVATSESSETAVLKACQLVAPSLGMRLWRNNVGAGKLDDGSFVRFGLANESEAMNRVIKSADLIGIKRVRITQDMVGQTFGQFVAFETKKPGWTYAARDREAAQAAFLALVEANGGRGMFVTDAGQLIDTSVKSR